MSDGIEISLIELFDDRVPDSVLEYAFTLLTWAGLQRRNEWAFDTTYGSVLWTTVFEAEETEKTRQEYQRIAQLVGLDVALEEVVALNVIEETVSISVEGIVPARVVDTAVAVGSTQLSALELFTLITGVAATHLWAGGVKDKGAVPTKDLEPNGDPLVVPTANVGLVNSALTRAVFRFIANDASSMRIANPFGAFAPGTGGAKFYGMLFRITGDLSGGPEWVLMGNRETDGSELGWLLTITSTGKLRAVIKDSGAVTRLAETASGDYSAGWHVVLCGSQAGGLTPWVVATELEAGSSAGISFSSISTHYWALGGNALPTAPIDIVMAFEVPGSVGVAGTALASALYASLAQGA
jgi:hypothetical protein